MKQAFVVYNRNNDTIYDTITNCSNINGNSDIIAIIIISSVDLT